MGKQTPFRRIDPPKFSGKSRVYALAPPLVPEPVNLISVTSILSALPKPALKYWGESLVAEAAVQQRAAWEGLEPEEAVDWLKGAPDRQMRSRGRRGTQIHEIAEAVLTGRMEPGNSLWAKHVLAFADEWVAEIIAVEQVCVHLEHGWAGTTDLIYRNHQGETILSDWKRQPLDTPLPTPTGWTTMGGVEVGDEVLDSNGRPCTVVAKSRVTNDIAWRMHFDDGTSIDSGDEHQWVTVAGTTQRPKPDVRTTREIAATMLNSAHQRQHRIMNTAPLDLPELIELPVHPYVLGCWLGDGSSASGVITKPDDNLWYEIERCGFALSEGYGATRGTTREQRNVYGLRTVLREAGLLNDKHIPTQYLRASIEQRTALLQGLMDTDGTWNTVRNQAVIEMVDKSLVEQVYELIVSLGQRAYFTELQGHGFGKDITRYRVSFTPVGFNPFRSTTKAERVNVPSDTRASRRLVTAVEPTIAVPMQCITVDSPDQTYLAGRQMVPTHNSSKDVYPDNALQLAAYAKASHWVLNTEGTQPSLVAPLHIDRLAVLHVQDEGITYYEPDYTIDHLYDVFRAVQSVWKALRNADTKIRLSTLESPPRPTVHEYVEHLRARCVHAQSENERFREGLLRRWPEGMPYLASGNIDNVRQCEKIDEVVTSLERDLQISFGITPLAVTIK